MLAGPGSGADALTESLGAQDAGTIAGLDQPFVNITSEATIAAGPNILLVMSDGLASIGGVQGLLKIPGVAQTPAGHNQRVIDMDDSVLLSFGSNTGRVLAAPAPRDTRLSTSPKRALPAGVSYSAKPSPTASNTAGHCSPLSPTADRRIILRRARRGGARVRLHNNNFRRHSPCSDRRHRGAPR